MLLHLHAVLDADELARARALLAGANWGDGRVTSGVQSALAKNNEQLPQEGEAAKALQRIVLAALNRHHLFFSAALPRRILPPLGGQFISLVKDSAMVSLISVQELTFLSNEVASTTRRTFETWIIAATFYFAMCLVFSLLFDHLERRARLVPR